MALGELGNFTPIGNAPNALISRPGKDVGYFADDGPELAGVFDLLTLRELTD